MFTGGTGPMDSLGRETRVLRFWLLQDKVELFGRWDGTGFYSGHVSNLGIWHPKDGEFPFN